MFAKPFYILYNIHKYRYLQRAKVYIRNSSKALIISGEKLLLNRCCSHTGEYYALPGGGQRPKETLEEALIREVREETGYTVKPLRLGALYERISLSKEEMTGHKLYFVFVCELEGTCAVHPSETDPCQTGTEWVPLDGIEYVNLYPLVIRAEIRRILDAADCLFLGSERRTF